jgi:hypothetical protein
MGYFAVIDTSNFDLVHQMKYLGSKALGRGEVGDGLLVILTNDGGFITYVNP